MNNISPTATSTQRREVEAFHLEILLPNKRPTEPTTSLLEMAPDPPRHAPRPPRHPQAQQGANLDHLTAAANHDAKAEEGGKCKSRGSLDNTRTHIRTGGGIGQPRTPRTLRTGNLGDFPQLYRPDDE
jgi:hypothetical protein